MAIRPVTVSQLNSYVKRVLASDPILSAVSVTGEISGLTKHSSGHWYFTLKDETSRLSCFLSREKVAALRYELEEGMKVVAYGSVSVYERGGSYSLYVNMIDPEGEGELKKAYELLRKKLAAEGLFDEARKRRLPPFPRRVGVVTSPTGAAVRDIITTIKRRSPLTDILIYPCLVQGEGAAASICEGLRVLNESFPDLDLIIAGRGGGSQEDLWAFNEEPVVRAVAASKIPVISAVGHEVDYVLTDYAADVRGATPTAAAELAVKDVEDARDRLRIYSPENLFHILESLVSRMEIMTRSAAESAWRGMSDKYSDCVNRLALLKLETDAACPLEMLKKGYSLTEDAEGKRISSVKRVKTGDRIKVRLYDGSLYCAVERTEAGDDI